MHKHMTYASYASHSLHHVLGVYQCQLLMWAKLRSYEVFRLSRQSRMARIELAAESHTAVVSACCAAGQKFAEARGSSQWSISMIPTCLPSMQKFEVFYCISVQP